MIQQPTLPLQQASVQPQAQYNAISISINGASVNAPNNQQPVVPPVIPQDATQNPVQQPEQQVQNINYLA